MKCFYLNYVVASNMNNNKYYKQKSEQLKLNLKIANHQIASYQIENTLVGLSYQFYSNSVRNIVYSRFVVAAAAIEQWLCTLERINVLFFSFVCCTHIGRPLYARWHLSLVAPIIIIFYLLFMIEIYAFLLASFRRSSIVFRFLFCYYIEIIYICVWRGIGFV